MKRIPLAVPDLRGRERELLVECVEENWISSAGPQVTAFEAATAKIAGRKHGIAVVNGTAGLHIALLAAGVAAGDTVIVPDWTFAASANAVAHAGAMPFFVDVAAEDWALDTRLVEEVLAGPHKIRAVLAVDPIGQAARFDELLGICRRHGVVLIEDAAAAIGASYKERPCGSFGDLSVFSFNGNKLVTTGGGGMVLTDDDVLARLIRHVSTQARPGRDYIHDRIGFNYRMTNVAAAIGLAQVERLAEMVAAKRAIAGRYDAAFAGRDDVAAMPRAAHGEGNCWLYNVCVASEQDATRLVADLDTGGVEARIFWRSLSAQGPWREAPRQLTGVSTSLSGTVVSLPCSSSLTRDDQDRVIDLVARIKLKPLQRRTATTAGAFS